MSSKTKFHLFSFHPKKLLTERIRVETKFGNIEEDVITMIAKDRLPKLLELIRATPFEKLEELIYSRMDVQILLYEYPYKEESVDTRKKINRVLLLKYVPLVGRTGWELFQHDTEDLFLHDLIRNSYFLDRDYFLNIDQEYLQPIGEAVLNKKGIVQGLSSYMATAKHAAQKVLSHWKIKEGSMLEKKIVLGMMKESRFSESIIARDSIAFVLRILKQCAMVEFKQLMKLYLEGKKHTAFHNKILERAISKLHDPRERMEDWEFLSESALNQVKRWLLSNELKRFFESDSNSERFDYWKRYIDYMEDVTLIKHPQAAIIYFTNLVVVEFGEIGAAYFYHKDGFINTMLKKDINSYKFRNASKSTREKLLKCSELERERYSLFITKLDHRGGWPRRFDNRITDILIKVNN